MPPANSELFLFGGEKPWKSQSINWTDVDDRVRGGSSQSHLVQLPNSTNARFYGKLDIKALGGAGFASQTTTGENLWDLSAYDGIQLGLVKGDNKVYTLVIKDEIPDVTMEDNKEMSTLSWEYDFQFENDSSQAKNGSSIWIPWSHFRATYRGRDKEDAPKLNTSEITRFSLMMRSFFEKQEGDFELVVASLSARKTPKATTWYFGAADE